MKALAKICFFILVISVITACSHSEKSMDYGTVEESVAKYDADNSIKQETAPAPADGNTATITERKLIKNGHINFESNNIAETKKNITDAVKKYNGYISNEDESKSDDRVYATITVRIPSARFDNFLTDATKGVDRFGHKNINIQDVTEEFLDIQARLKTKKELENRYTELLKQAKNVTEILEIERQSNNLRSEIESIEGRLKYLNSQIDYSTLHMAFYEKRPGTSGFGYKIVNGFGTGWNMLLDVIILFTELWPFIVIAIIVVVIVKRWRRRKRKQQD